MFGHILSFFSYHLLGFVVLQWQYGGRKVAGRSSFRNPPNQLFSWTLKCIPWQSTRTKSAMCIVQAVSMFTWIADFMERVETTADPVHTALTLCSHTSNHSWISILTSCSWSSLLSLWSDIVASVYESPEKSHSQSLRLKSSMHVHWKRFESEGLRGRVINLIVINFKTSLPCPSLPDLYWLVFKIALSVTDANLLLVSD